MVADLRIVRVSLAVTEVTCTGNEPKVGGKWGTALAYRPGELDP